uniref:Uncharacterized protein n=1 Tax=Pyricularia oryzae (strain P131) TaxID=1143193 RepID=L7IQY9_PYRO1
MFIGAVEAPLPFILVTWEWGHFSGWV